MSDEKDVATKSNLGQDDENELVKYVLSSAQLGIRSANDLDIASEELYNEVSRDIVETSKDQLIIRNKQKGELREGLSKYFKCFLGLQYFVLVAFLSCQGLGWFYLPTEVIVAYIASVFVETLGGLIVMVKFAFESTQETQIMGIMHNFLKDFKKHSDNKKQ